MKYDFDEVINREGTDSIKYDLRKDVFGREDVLPLWVADMDFSTPDFIRKAVIQRAGHPVYGYTFRGSAFKDSIRKWMKLRHNWEVDADWICFSPGIVPALNIQVLALTEPGDGILIQPPVYFPFMAAVNDHHRKLIVNQLVNKEGKYSIDFEDFRDKAKEAKVFILCHPHNPVGRAWEKNELEKMTEICREHNVKIISDEIHSDLILNDSQHIPLIQVKGASDITLAGYSPSKTFNLAGLSTAFLIIPDAKLRSKYEKTLNALHMGMGNIFGYTALEAAYGYGSGWLGQLIGYLKANVDLLEEYIAKYIPEIELTRPEATYLAWMNFGSLGFTDRELNSFIINEAKLGLNDGPRFGPGGNGFQRINIALPRQNLEKALDQLASAVRNHHNR